MEVLKIDKTKLRTAKTYAEMTGLSIQHVYRLMNDKKVKVVSIDGVKFVQV